MKFQTRFCRHDHDCVADLFHEVGDEHRLEYDASLHAQHFRIPEYSECKASLQEELIYALGECFHKSYS